MRKMLFGALPRVLILLTVVAWSFAVAKEDPANPSNRGNSLDKTTGTPLARPLNINNFVTWMKATGQGNWTAKNTDGGYYPRGTSWAIYQDGFEFAGKPYLDAAHTQPALSQSEVRAGGQSYNVGTREGRIIGTGATAVAANTNDADVRIFRIRRDYASMTEDELRRDAAEVGEKLLTDVTSSDMDAIVAGYATDWVQWPVAYGAPYVERNGTPGFQQPPAFSKNFTVDSLISGKYDEPGIAGSDPNSPADQVMWTVFNDLSTSQSLALWGSDPVGLEFQCTIWGYKRADALGQLYFKKYRIINKGGAIVNPSTQAKGAFYLDSLYFAQWSDPDLGGSGDDLVGCDTTLSMGYIYNGNAVDAEYKKFSLAPPAAGYDFLQGPIVPSPGGRAVFDLKNKPNFVNLPMTSFAFFSAGSAISDPPFTYEGAKRWYRMMQGYVPDASTAPWRLYASGPFAPSKFPFSGDPVTKSGFVDGLGTDYSLAPGDRRLLLCSGPITMAPGDTQEVVVGVVGGLGSDRISSVGVMKFNDEFVQLTYNALFAVPRAPAAPIVKTVQLNEQVVIEWGSNLQRVTDTETQVLQPGNYKFEGYNVYQVPSIGSPLKEGKLIATFDLDTDPAVILDRQFDQKSGLVLDIPVQFGKNSGINRQFVLDRDYLKDVNKLYNGSQYFIAVTAYSYTTEFLPRSLESSPTVIRVVPQAPPPGTRYSAAYGKGLVLSHPTGVGDVVSEVSVVDPTALTGQKYTISWSTVPNQFGGEFLGTDADGNTIYTLSLSGTMNEAGTRLDYKVQLSNIDSLYTTITSMEFRNSGPDSSGPLAKTVPFTTPLVGGIKYAVASGSWSSTDATQPLTPALYTQLVNERIYLVVNTVAEPADGTNRAQLGWTSFPYVIKRGTTTLVSYQTNYSMDENYPVFDGLKAKLSGVNFKAPLFIGSWDQITKAVATTKGFLPPSGGTGGASLFGTGSDLAAGLFTGSGAGATLEDLVQDLELRFTGVRVSPNAEDTLIVSGGSIATVMNSSFSQGARVRIPFELWENDANGRTRQINVAIRDRNADATHPSPWGNSGVPLYMRIRYGRAYIEAIATPYDPDESAAALTRVPARPNPKGTWAIVPAYAASPESHWDTGDIIKLSFPNTVVPGTDEFTFNAPAAAAYDAANAKADVGRVGVFPNPYYAFNPQETSRQAKFVTFTKLPPKATIRIFNIAGQLVRVIDKNDGSQYLRWDLRNKDNFPVASGMYIVHVDMPDIQATKVLKVAIIQEQEVPDVF